MALVLLACCVLLVSSFEAAKKKITDKAKKQTATSASFTATAATSPPHTATISPEGVVTVDEPASASPPAAATTTAAAAATAAPAVKAKPSKPAVAQSTSSAESVSDAVPVLSGPLILPVEHDLVGDGSWTERGMIEVTFGSGGGQRAAVKLSELTLTSAEQQQLLKLAANSGYYRVRVRGSSPQEPGKDTAAVMASNRACALVASALHENLVLHFDIHGTLLSITYTSPINSCPAPAPTALPSGASSFTSRAKLSFGRTAERPQNIRVRQQPGEAGLAQAEGGGAGGEGKGAEEQSFFMKYAPTAHNTHTHTHTRTHTHYHLV